MTKLEQVLSDYEQALKALHESQILVARALELAKHSRIAASKVWTERIEL